MLTAWNVIQSGALAWWLASTLALAASFCASVLFPWPRRVRHTAGPLPGVTAVVPVKELHAHFEAAQTSLLVQHYPELEIVITAASQDAEALPCVRRIAEQHPERALRISCSPVARTASPKLNNMWVPLSEARHDIVLTKDSNVVLAPDDLLHLVEHLEPGVGLVSAVPVATAPRSLPAWIEAAMINGYFARFLMLGRALGLGFGCGKVMLFRMSDVNCAGGLSGLAWALGEDAALSRALAGAKLRTVLADRVSVQPLGDRKWVDVWNRQLRWRIIWRVQEPVVFVATLFASALTTAAAGAIAAPLFGYSSFDSATATLVLWFALETIFCQIKGLPVSGWSPIAFLGRESLDLMVWLRALTTSKVDWAGMTYRAGVRGAAVRIVAD